jgi:hypothetical protein
MRDGDGIAPLAIERRARFFTYGSSGHACGVKTARGGGGLGLCDLRYCAFSIGAIGREIG